MAGGRTGAAAGNIVVSLVVGGVFASLTATALSLALLTVWILGVGVFARALALQLTAKLAGFDRWRLEWFGAARLEAPAVPVAEVGAGFRERQLAWGRAPWLWRLPAYQLLRLPLAAAIAFAAVGWAWATIACFILAAQPRSPILVVAWSAGPVDLNPFQVLVLVATGIVGIAGWAGLLRAGSSLDAAVARALLGPSRSGQLSAEVTRLSAARALAVESAEAERRRIERDLHDGLQPQLVSLALDLGLARSRMHRDPEGAQAMVERAHQEAKRAAEDLRNLVRGIHPSVLDERGLDAALSALVASCPVPIAVSVDLPNRPPQTCEAVAYFVVAEAITNITKHSDASMGRVVVLGDGSTLSVLVEDDGKGGARLEPAGGLAGLAGRVRSVDGRFSLSSPPGGPTRVEAVIPWVQ